MQDHSNRVAAPAILIAEVEGAYWMLEGDRHLGAMLTGQAPFPTPVCCLRFASSFEFATALEGISPTELWNIHPAVVARLERAGDLAFVTLDDAD